MASSEGLMRLMMEELSRERFDHPKKTRRKASKDMRRFPLVPASKEEAERRAQHLFAQRAREANVEAMEAGHGLWCRVEAGVPPTLCVVLGASPRLSWHDGRGARKEWAWKGEWPDVVEQKKLVARLSTWRPWGEGSRRRARTVENPLAVLKIAPSARGSPLGLALEREFPVDTGSAALTGHAIAMVQSRDAVATLVAAALSTEPRGTGAVCVQAYVRSNNKGGLAWVARCVVGRRKKPRGWIISSDGDATNTGCCRRCSIVRASPQSASWAEPKALATKLLARFNAEASPRLEELAADFVQDEAGGWWLLQVKGYKLSKPGPLRWLKRRRNDVATPNAYVIGPGCEGEFCDMEIPTDDRHLYYSSGDEDDKTPPRFFFTLPRKVLVDHPRSLRREAPNVASMSKRERLALYNNIKVCANCHYEYVGRLKAKRFHELSPHGAKARVPLPPVVDDLLSPTAPSEATRLPPLLPTSPPQQPSGIEIIRTKDSVPSSPHLAKQSAPEKKSDSDSAASILRAAMEDIDSIHSRAAVEMEHAMNANLAASIFLASVDEATRYPKTP